MTYPVVKDETDWKATLSPARFQVLRKAGTERAFAGVLTDTEEPGVYKCGACQATLFTSDQKYHSGCGWPAFSDVIPGAVVEKVDRTLGMTRTEVLCANCGSHLGHVFDDGPWPTGQRYCINSVSVDLERPDGSVLPGERV